MTEVSLHDEFGSDESFVVSGCIQRCRDAGIPDSLLLPIRPWNRPDAKGGGAGKAPAAYSHQIGEWVGLTSWTSMPVHPGNLHDASELGGNAGLILGVPATVTTATGRTAALQFAAIDIDLDEPTPDKPLHDEAGLIADRNTILTEIARAFGPLTLVRESRPYRGLVLAAHGGLLPGRKCAFRVMKPTLAHDAIQIGKIELLTTGQQCVIAGRHSQGYPLLWHRADAPDAPRLPYPPITTGLPVTGDFNEILRILADAFTRLRALGFRIELVSAANPNSGPVSEQELAPADLSVPELVAVIDSMTNVGEVDYDTFQSVMLAIAGTVRGISAHRGELSAGDTAALEAAVVGWMVRWDHAHCPDAEAALASWRGDWGRPDKERRSGWSKLCAVHRQLTRDSAANDFTDASPAAEARRREHIHKVAQARDIISRHRMEMPDRSAPQVGSAGTAGESGTPGAPGPDLTTALLEKLSAPSSGDYFAEAKAALFEPADQGEPTAGIASKQLTILTPDQCSDARQRPYVVKRLIGMGDTGILSGLPGAGKSALAPHWAYAVAQGRSVHGLRVRPGPVLYVAAEDGDGMRVRIRALLARYGDAPNFHLIPHDVDLMHDGASLTALIDAVRQIRPVLIVIDTLKRAFPGIKENSGEDDGMGRVIYVSRGLTRICNSAVLILHHMPHGADRSRGHTSLPADVDVDMVIRTNPETKVRTVSFLKNRNGTSDKTFNFGVRAETLGFDEDGDPITAVVAEEVCDTPAPMTKSPESGLSDMEKKALHVLREITSPGSRVTEDAWKAECEKRRISGATQTKGRTQAFTRTHGPLINAGLIGMGDGMVWVIPQQREVTEFEAQVMRPVGKPFEGLV